MTQGDGFDRLFGHGAPAQKPLDPAKPQAHPAKPEVVWTDVQGKPWLEQSNETPPRLRTKHYQTGNGYPR